MPYAHNISLISVMIMKVNEAKGTKKVIKS